MIKQILDELNLENGSNYKIAVLEKYKDNELLKRVLKMTYDKVCYTYGITMKNIIWESESQRDINATLIDALDYLEEFLNTREHTGHKALKGVTNLLERLPKDDAEILEKIINRDLRINLGTKQINKVFKNLIFEVPYQRCSLPSEKTFKNINYPAYSQEKCDGRFCYVVKDTDIRFFARSGEENYFPELAKEFENIPNGVYTGELLVHSETNRFLANGLINSDNPPSDIFMVCWDYLTIEEFNNKRSNRIYKDRFSDLMKNIRQSGIHLVDTKIVQNYEEAYHHFTGLLKEGKEGTILKDMSSKWKSNTATDQIKMKMEMTIDVRCVGFVEGKGRLKNSLGALEFQTDDKTVIGTCSGFSDEQRQTIWNNKEKYLNRVFEVKCNEVTKAKNKDTYGLSYPNFVEFRDKDTTDNIERVLEIRDSVLGV